MRVSEAVHMEVLRIIGARIRMRSVHIHTVDVNAHGSQRLTITAVQPIDALITLRCDLEANTRPNNVSIGRGLLTNLLDSLPLQQIRCNVPIGLARTIERYSVHRGALLNVRLLHALLIMGWKLGLKKLILAFGILTCEEKLLPSLRLEAKPDKLLAEHCPCAMRHVALMAIEHLKHHLWELLQRCTVGGGLEAHQQPAPNLKELFIDALITLVVTCSLPLCFPCPPL